MEKAKFQFYDKNSVRIVNIKIFQGGFPLNLQANMLVCYKTYFFPNNIYMFIHLLSQNIQIIYAFEISNVNVGIPGLSKFVY